MTTPQALKKARLLFGPQACVEDKKKPTIVNGHILSDRFIVGRVLMGMFFSVEGDGPTWESAFNKAALRKNRK